MGRINVFRADLIKVLDAFDANPTQIVNDAGAKQAARVLREHLNAAASAKTAKSIDDLVAAGVLRIIKKSDESAEYICDQLSGTDGDLIVRFMRDDAIVEDCPWTIMYVTGAFADDIIEDYEDADDVVGWIQRELANAD